MIKCIYVVHGRPEVCETCECNKTVAPPAPVRLRHAWGWSAKRQRYECLNCPAFKHEYSGPASVRRCSGAA